MGMKLLVEGSKHVVVEMNVDQARRFVKQLSNGLSQVPDEEMIFGFWIEEKSDTTQVGTFMDMPVVGGEN